MIKRISLLLLFVVAFVATTFAQIKGRVVDKETGEPIPYLSVYYEGKGVGTITNDEGYYNVSYVEGCKELTFSMVGYKTVVKVVSASTKTLNVKMTSDNVALDEVVIKPTSDKYSRKNNPAVEMIKKVIASKKRYNWRNNDYFSYSKYQKITFSVNNITEDSLRNSKFLKKYAFVNDQIETCDITGKNIMPLAVSETVSEFIYRKEPEKEREIIRGMHDSGVNEIFATGDMLTNFIKDMFQDINIYDDQFRFLQYPFESPISKNGISFYKYYIMDTLMVDKDECFQMTFVPNNSLDFGFTGVLYIHADSTYRLKKCILNLPKNTGVNFVDNMVITQTFGELFDGEWGLLEDDVLCELSYLKALLGSFQIRKVQRNSDFSTEKLPESLFKQKPKVVKDVNAMMRDDEFWDKYRGEENLTHSEKKMDSFVDQLSQIKGIKYIVFAVRALIENTIETGTKGRPSKIDITPVNTIISQNYVDGLRLRGSLHTTAKLFPHAFLSGYYAYGFKDKRSKYKGQFEYSFNKREFLPHEFPIHSLTFTYWYDNMTPADKFMDTDKDNIFASFKAYTIDQFNYERTANIKYVIEKETGWKTTLELKHTNFEPCGKLFYRTPASDAAFNKQYAPEEREAASLDVNNPYNIHDFTIAEATLGVRFAPGETFVNTKQRRLPVNLDAPVFTLRHTVGVKGVLGSDYNYNFTNASFYKRFWMHSWGHIDLNINGGIQWNKVPFPLLIMPAANVSVLLQENTFNLINNMEFLNDRYASLDLSWNLHGKLFNRIPLLKKLKWREFLGVKCLWGTLTDKNNPFKHPESTELFMFPGHYDANGTFVPSSNVMDPKKPYVEISAGIHNIFKLLHIEYVHRLNYNYLPTAHNWGIRFMIRTVF